LLNLILFPFESLKVNFNESILSNVNAFLSYPYIPLNTLVLYGLIVWPKVTINSDGLITSTSK